MNGLDIWSSGLLGPLITNLKDGTTIQRMRRMKLIENSTDCLETWYSGVLGVVDHESEAGFANSE